MAFQPLVAAGYSGSTVHFVGSDTLTWVCGNTLVVHNLASDAQVRKRLCGA